jgi:hypothetical protein
VFQEVPALEQRLSDLQAQIDRLTIALQFWRDGHERSSSAHARSDPRSQGLLEEWVAIGERHARAVEALEQQIGTLRASQVAHIDPAEPAVADEPPPPDVATDDDTALFERFAPIVAGPAPRAVQSPSTGTRIEPTGDARDQWPSDLDVGAGDATTNRMAGIVAMLRNSDSRVSDLAADQERIRRRLFVSLLLVIAALAGSGWWTWQLQRDLGRALMRLSDVEQRSSVASSPGATDSVPSRAETSSPTTAVSAPEARSDAMRAVLAAPDVVRVSLAGQGASAAAAELLWSRSRGTAIAATGLATPPAGSVYQAWLAAGASLVNIGTLVPDAAGRATLVIDTPASVPGPVTGGLISVESQAGSAAPSDHIVARSGGATR